MVKFMERSLDMGTKEYYLDTFIDYLNKNDKSSGTISTYTANIKGFIKLFSPPRNVRKLMVLPVQKMMDIISIS